jgi:ribosomal protein S18 acetylase RimI-like enzyme
VVSPATADDLEACVSLALAVLGGETEGWRDRFTRELADPRRFLVVASVDGELAGFGRTAFFEPPPDAAPDVAPQGYYLTGVVVAPSARRRGVGHLLTEARLDWIRARAVEAWYFANATNDASLALHRAFGFVEVTRTFSFPEVTFDGGEGVLCRATLLPWS